EILENLYEMTNRRFDVLEHLIKNKEWDFFMFVEIGVDRIHHAFWKFFDEEHHFYEKNNKYENVIRDYYKFLDKRIGNLLEIIGVAGKETHDIQDNIHDDTQDDTHDKCDTKVLIVSDHGVKRMKGGFCVNEWLIKEGYLVLKETKETQDCTTNKDIISIEKADVDWSKTKAWGWGGYYARIFLNIHGREDNGIIDPANYEDMRDELTEKLNKIRDPEGNLMNMRVFKPEEIYDKCNGNPSDLMVYFDDLYWRSIGTIGHKSMYLRENDLGPDDAMHSEYGIFIMYDPEIEEMNRCKEVDNLSIMDVAPTILNLMGVDVPEDMGGKVICARQVAQTK
ncbi:MAG: alkaline phosphatase family protein, partial [Candidatus Heimdallarchaeota archaeon]|nr:alkaline phosphatase family protein [Candidatus Heimdallarchaeota archaeon]